MWIQSFILHNCWLVRTQSLWIRSFITTSVHLSRSHLGTIHSCTLWQVHQCSLWGPNKTNTEHTFIITILTTFPWRFTSKLHTPRLTPYPGVSLEEEALTPLGGDTSGKYWSQIWYPRDSPKMTREPTSLSLAMDVFRILPHDNDLMVIILQHVNWDIKRVLIDLGSSIDILL